MDSNRHEEVNTSSCVDSIQTETTKVEGSDSRSDNRLTENTLSKSKANSFHPVNNGVPLILGKIDQDKRQKLKYVLNLCIAEGVKKMNNLTDMKQGIHLIVQNIEARRMKPLENDTGDGLTLSQCVAEINKLDPDTLTDHKSVALPLNYSNPIEASISGTNTIGSGNDTINSQSFTEESDADESRSTEIKHELVDNQLHDLNNVDLSNSRETHKVPKDETSNHSPVITPRRTRNRTTGSFRLSTIRKIEKTNHKITEYFQKCKSKDTTPVAQKSKRENIDPAFILTALKGDPNYCVVCKKTFTSSYLKTHLTEQHGIDKESIRSRSIKKENMTNLLCK